MVDIGSKYNKPQEELCGTKGFPATLDDRIEEILSNGVSSWIDFIYKDTLHYTLWLYPDDPFKYKECIFGKIGIEIAVSALDPVYSKNKLGEEEAIKRCVKKSQSVIELAKTLWNVLEPKPIYGVGDQCPDEGVFAICYSDEEISDLKIEPNIFWLNFFGSELVKKFGKEKLLTIPAYKVEELNGGVMFLKSLLPSDYETGMNTYKEICEHLKWKIYSVDIFNIEKFKPTVTEDAIHETKFQDINTLKEYLEGSMDEFRKTVEDGRIFVILEHPSGKPVPQHVREMERWLQEEMRVDVRISRW